MRSRFLAPVLAFVAGAVAACGSSASSSEDLNLSPVDDAGVAFDSGASTPPTPERDASSGGGGGSVPDAGNAGGGGSGAAVDAGGSGGGAGSFDAGGSGGGAVRDAGSPSSGPNLAKVCAACTANADCGSGGFCVQGRCAMGPCTSSAQCGTGQSCFNLTNGTQTVGTACFPTSQSCAGGAVADAGTAVRDAGTAVRDAGSTPTTDAGAAACTTDTYATYAKAFFQQNCDGCHGHAFGSSYATFNVAKTSVRSRINSGSMPPSPLSASVKTRILKWIDCGAPQ